MQPRIKRAARLGLIGSLAVVAVLGAVPAANAGILHAAAAPAAQASTAPVEGQLDPATYEGALIVATDKGDVVVTVEAGEGTLFTNRADGNVDSLPAEAAEIVDNTGVSVADAESGRLSQSEMGTLASCGVWLNAVAGPGVYWETVDGCAVAGYPGYKREYSWDNKSDVLICAQGRGWNPSLTWYGLGCSYDGGTASVPWGNSFAYTKVKAMSVSGVTGAGYSWRT